MTKSSSGNVPCQNTKAAVTTLKKDQQDLNVYGPPWSTRNWVSHYSASDNRAVA